MRRFSFRIFAIPAAAMAIGIPVASAQMPQISLSAGIHVVRAEVANTNESRMQGLMFRKSLGPNDGMLFVFPQDEAYCMWMKNTPIPLSVAFIDANGKIVSIHEMQPQTERSHCATGMARYALEMNAGWFRAKGIQRGMRIAGIDKAPGPR